MKPDLRGLMPESWACIDCGFNTGPGCLNREQMEQRIARPRAGEGVEPYIDDQSEVYMVTPAVWEAAGMEPAGGCLCIGCLEKRLGRTLTPKDFYPRHPCNRLPGTERLLSRRNA
jgi:hypothetical protein